MRPYFYEELINYHAIIKFEEPDNSTPGPNNTVIYETFKMNKNMLMLNTKFGFEVIILKKAVLDLSAGLLHRKAKSFQNCFFPDLAFDKYHAKYFIVFVPVDIKLGVTF